MRFAFFFVPAEGGPAADELNRFLGAHRVVSVDREIVRESARCGWAFCVGWTESGSPAASAAGPPKVDYKEILSPEQFERFARLRELRKQLAERDGVPPYSVFTNEQLAEMVRRPARTSAELAAIPGVGPSRVEKYGGAFLAALGA